MRKNYLIAVVLFLQACATAHKPTTNNTCTAETAYKKGLALNQNEDPEVVWNSFCAGSNRKDAKEAYLRGLEERRKKMNSLGGVVRAVSSQKKWLCEVEGERKIFTGVADSQLEAMGVARQNCSKHFKSNACLDAGCQLNF
ncbi:MAG: hypothetical protein M9962_03960 [Oligoflexia bacterium]|nr:hypothetical protein [Oligoflexia bacterium]